MKKAFLNNYNSKLIEVVSFEYRLNIMHENILENLLSMLEKKLSNLKSLSKSIQISSFEFIKNLIK